MQHRDHKTTNKWIKPRRPARGFVTRPRCRYVDDIVDPNVVVFDIFGHQPFAVLDLKGQSQYISNEIMSSIRRMNLSYLWHELVATRGPNITHKLAFAFATPADACTFCLVWG